MSTLSQIGQGRGFCRQIVRVWHPDWPPERIDAFWRSLNAPAARRQEQRQRQEHTPRTCQRCQQPYILLITGTARGNNRRYCDACQAIIEAENRQKANANRNLVRKEQRRLAATVRMIADRR
jgi:hypothetical protein